MSYQVLARKWRPKKFTELVGQEHVVTVLVNALQQKRLHHAYLFTGTRGVGKTTIARIFAKSLNCETGITSNPCGICDTCQDIDNGRFIDLLEIDAASKTKVDDTREILDNVQYLPTRGRFKVYLIDEVHMLSRSSFNALLKTLEEPPEHVKFILATTDPQKLPVTVLSRCLQFNLKALTVNQIEQKTQQILEAEHVSFENGSLSLLAKAARGSMRDCLSLTDQSIAQGQGNITLANIQQMLGGVDQNWVYKILIALLKQEPKVLMELSLEIASYAPNYSRLTAELIQLLHQVAMTQIVGNHFDLSPEHNQLVDKFSQAMSPEDIQLYYQIVLNGRKDLPYASDEQAAFDMLLLRMLAFTPRSNSKNLAEQAALTSTGESTTIVSSKGKISHFDEVVLAPTNINIPEKVSELAENISDNQHTVSSVLISEETINAPAFSETVQVKDLSSSQETIATQQVTNGPEGLAELSHVENNQKQQQNRPEAEYLPAGVQSRESNHAITQHTEQVIDSSPALNTAPEIPTAISPIEKVLATRNMLRSRKKSLESSTKKSNGAKERQDDSQIETKAKIENVKPRADIPAIETMSGQVFDVDEIDPAKIRSANQVDKWANMIDAMSLNGRLRQLAIHATVSDKSTDDLLLLHLDQSTKHLNSDVAHKKLEQCISEFLNRKITVELTIVEETTYDPYKIQSDINEKRYGYAKDLLEQDEIVIGLKTHFQAELDENTIVAL
ncbi:MAG: DNA polymerase III subunit gamma/tau [Colwellia sp.]|nr:DNA polymerase III subunit gamma/tau [Colwellia sp.]